VSFLNPEKANNTKTVYSKTKLAWCSRLLRHSARKQDGLILQLLSPHGDRKTVLYWKECFQHYTRWGGTSWQSEQL